MMSSPISGSRHVASCASICWRRSPDAGAWVVSMMSAIPLILVRDLDIDIAVLDRYRVGLRRDDRRQARDLAGPYVEARAMPWAFDRHLPELPLAERILLVGTVVADRVEVLVFGVDEADRLAIHLHPDHRLLRQLAGGTDPLPGHATRGKSRDPDISQSGRPVPARPPLGPGQRGVGRGPRQGTPGPACARRWDAECRDSRDRRGAPGQPGPPSHRGCSAGCRCSGSRGSAPRLPSPSPRGAGCGWPGSRNCHAPPARPELDRKTRSWPDRAALP